MRAACLSSARFGPETGWPVISPKGHEPVFLLCNVEEDYVRGKSWIEDIRSHVEFKTSPVHLLAEVLEEMELSASRVEIEIDFITHHTHGQLMEKLPELSLLPCQELIAWVRMIKTEREIEIGAAGFRGSEEALMATFSATQIGEMEKSMSNTGWPMPSCAQGPIRSP